MKLKFKINLKKSKIPEWIKVPKTLIEGRLLKGKLTNLVEKKYLKETFNFEYDKKNKLVSVKEKKFYVKISQILPYIKKIKLEN
jgi:hypothetical protein